MKRQLVLARHTKSSWADYSLNDFNRPLKKNRMNEAVRMAAHLKELGFLPDLVICSPALRTAQTAELFCKGLDYRPNDVIRDILLYESSAAEYKRVLEKVKPEFKSLLLIGHNPSLTDFANRYLPIRIDELPTTGVIWVEFESSNWKFEENTLFSLKYFLFPGAI